MPPVAGVGFGTAGTLGAATVSGVVTAAGVGGDETVVDDDVDGRDEVAGPLEAAPQPDISTAAASSTVIDLMALFMVPLPGQLGLWIGVWPQLLGCLDQSMKATQPKRR